MQSLRVMLCLKLFKESRHSGHFRVLPAARASQMVLPNFYFHITTAYAILSHNGVDLGKRDYIGGLTMRDG